MNEIERFIADLPRPSPSETLDARVLDVLNRPLRVEQKKSLMRRILILTSTAACAGCVGFALGRQSISAAHATQSIATQPVAMPTAATPAMTPTTIVAPVEGEALARFVMPRRMEPSLFGAGPLEERNTSLPVE